MASMNTTINEPIKRAGEPTKGRQTKDIYEFYERTARTPAEPDEIQVDWAGNDVDIYNDTFGCSSIKKVIGELSRNNRGVKYLNQLELAQKLTRTPEEDFLKADLDEQTRQGHAEQEAIQNILTSAKRGHAQKIQNNHSKMDNLKNNAVVVLREKLQKKYDDYLTEIQDEKKRLKNAKRNAKRKARQRRRRRH